jgi:bifunctional DNase/RNase
MDTKVKLKVKAVTDSKVQAGAYALILIDESSERRLPIIVGMAEAQAILIAIEGIVPPRPLTHDLFPMIFNALDATVKSVFIYKFEDGVFYSNLTLEIKRGELTDSVVIDARTSDAIAIALRVNCDIFIEPDIMTECEIPWETDSGEEEANDDEEFDDDDDDEDDDEDYEGDDNEAIFNIELAPDNDISNPAELAYQSIDDLNRRMERSISREDYEQAQIYRDEIRRRAGNDNPESNQ